jgi:hypothetical protein
MEENFESVSNKIIVTIEGNDWIRNYEDFNLTFESSENEILTAIKSAIEEEFNVDISEYYKVRKATNLMNIHVIPNSTAG